MIGIEVNEVIEVIASLEVNDVTSFLFEVNEVNGVIASLEVSDDTNADVFFFLSLFFFFCYLSFQSIVVNSANFINFVNSEFSFLLFLLLLLFIVPKYRR
ncbi:hypothetical protein C7Y71_004065 [Pseudoprevotella muciniphila]|uniref:Uncharacterized protein n=1 Tax=Pseudoprevotella muciniphila TaxID=2133944 RepID=A0A5P8E5S5_9BACT|nr:hypothetical protein C7Y71_004065 [Pseudoprevotella muciniphila]